MTAVLTAPALCTGSDIDAWLAQAGGQALEHALADPAAILPDLERSGLRGQGGAGYPTHLKWAAVASQPGPATGKWLICNGNEDEPGTFKDRFLLTKTPHQVIEGALIAALAVGASNLVFYINPHEQQAVQAMRRAAEAWPGLPLFQRLCRELSCEVGLHVFESSGRYVGGEETAVIASIMGGFPFPAQKPPFPAQSGINKAPTLLNNVETFAHVTQIFRHGPDWYRSLGIGDAVGTKLYSLSGDVLRPGLHEMPMGSSLRELIYQRGGGLIGGRAFKAIFTGGPSNTLLTASDLDVALDFGSLKQRGSRLGTGAMIVVGEGTSILRKTAEYIAFFAANSCGQCQSCKIGTHQVSRILDRINLGDGRKGDIDALHNLSKLMLGSGRCGLVDGAATVLASSINTFPQEYQRAVQSASR